MTGTIQPPLLAWAWRIAVGDPAAEPAIARHHEWLRGEPRPRGRRPAVARPAGRVGARLLAQVRSGVGMAGAREAGLPAAGGAQPAARLGRAAGPGRRRPGALRGRDQRAVGARAPGDGRAVDHAGARRPPLGRAAGLFLDEAQPGGLRPAVETWAALAPLALPDLPEAIGRRLVEEHLLDPRRFWLPVPPPSVSAAEPSFEPGTGRAG